MFECGFYLMACTVKVLFAVGRALGNLITALVIRISEMIREKKELETKLEKGLGE